MSGFFAAAGAAIDRIKINDLQLAERGGRSVWMKRRRHGAKWVLHAANLFFKAARNPVRVLHDFPEWQRWEIESFEMLHGNEFWIGTEKDAVMAEALPGESLSAHLRKGDLEENMCQAAGLELRRAHSIHSPAFGDAWSHGDPHLGNFIFSSLENRARLIDFEVMHEPALPVVERHADDLLVFLLDLCGRCAAQRWLPLGLAFVNGYGVPNVLDILKNRLSPPTGVAAIWWSIRSTYMSRAELSSRLQQLRASL